MAARGRPASFRIGIASCSADQWAHHFPEAEETTGSNFSGLSLARIVEEVGFDLSFAIYKYIYRISAKL